MTYRVGAGPGPDETTAKGAVERAIAALCHEKSDAARYLAGAVLEKAARDIEAGIRTANAGKKALYEMIDIRHPFVDDIDRYIAEAMLDRLEDKHDE